MRAFPVSLLVCAFHNVDSEGFQRRHVSNVTSFFCGRIQRVAGEVEYLLNLVAGADEALRELPAIQPHELPISRVLAQGIVEIESINKEGCLSHVGD